MPRSLGRDTRRRDTQKTQHGIETPRCQYPWSKNVVETLRKPSTGLKPVGLVCDLCEVFGRDTQKTQHGIETATGEP